MTNNAVKFLQISDQLEEHIRETLKRQSKEFNVGFACRRQYGEGVLQQRKLLYEFYYIAADEAVMRW